MEKVHVQVVGVILYPRMQILLPVQFQNKLCMKLGDAYGVFEYSQLCALPKNNNLKHIKGRYTYVLREVSDRAEYPILCPTNALMSFEAAIVEHFSTLQAEALQRDEQCKMSQSEKNVDEAMGLHKYLRKLERDVFNTDFDIDSVKLSLCLEHDTITHQGDPCAVDIVVFNKYRKRYL